MRDRRVGILIVAAVAVVVFLGALANGFAYDDVPAILGDPRVVGDASWLEILTRPYWTANGESFGLYRPIVTLSFALDWTLSGGSTTWFHAINLAWNALAAVLVFVLLRRLFEPGAALVGALFFAVHPAHVEAVANIVGRADVMAAAFMFGAALVWLRDSGWWRAPVVALLFACALLTKESAAMLPLLLVLLDFAAGRWRANTSELAAYARRHASAFALLLIVGVAWLLVRHAVLGGMAPVTLHPAADVAHGRTDLLRTALTAWPQYVRLLLAPFTLLADYGPRILMPAHEWSRAAVLGLTILVGLLGGGAIAIRRGWGRRALALLWLPIAILPASNLIVTIGTLVAERTLYVPSFAAAVLVSIAWGRAAPGYVRPAVLRAALVAVVALFAVRSALRVPEWRSTGSIFAALHRDAPDSYRAVWYRARVIRAENGPAAAHRQFLEAIELWPYRKGLVFEAIANAIEAGHRADAQMLAAHAAHTWPDDPAAHRLHAATSLDLGDTLTAARASATGLALDPSDEMLRSMQRAIAEGEQ